MRLVHQVQIVILFKISTYLLALAEDGPCSCELDEIGCGDPRYDPETFKGIELKDNDLGLKQARENTWPWLVSLRRKGADGVFRHECGGTLVSSTIVISAAHCLTYSDDATDFEIELAPHSLSRTNKDGLVKVKQFLFPNVNQPAKKLFPHDILVITLDKPVMYNDAISPACFGVADFPVQEAECYAVGWGKYLQSKITQPTNDILVQLFSIPFEGEYCRVLMGVNRTEFNSETMTCSPLEQHKTCHVDSGGPLMCKVNGVWRLYGVLNSAHKCTRDSSIATYSMVKRYWKFLVDNIGRTNRPIASPPILTPKITIPESSALPNDLSLNDKHCGVPEFTPLTEVLNPQRRIIGGSEARRNSWPWQVSLRHKGTDGVFRHKCGGTLVSRTKVVSAAHCLAYSENATDYEVQLAAHVLSETNKEGLVKVGKINLPSGDNAKKQKYPSDIMVITLVQPVMYNDKISPACFGSANIESDKILCYVTGWGKNVSHNSTITSKYLKQLRVPIHKQEDCKKYIGRNFNPNLMMCAGSLSGDSDTCQGDSGGPLVCYVDEKWSLYGVVIFGKECAVKDSPTVYAKVDAHWKFLQEAIKN